MSSTELVLPSDEFSVFCAEELERNLNSGLAFDREAFEEAMEMALKKLKRIEEEGLA